MPGKAVRPFTSQYPGPRQCLTATAGSYTTTRCLHESRQSASHWHLRLPQPKGGKKEKPTAPPPRPPPRPSTQAFPARPDSWRLQQVG